MVALSIGVILAVVLAVTARVTRFDVDRSYYATVLIVIASYYVLFAFMAGEAIIIETLAATAFLVIAMVGAYRWAPLIGIGILLHGIFDFVHPHIVQNTGVPLWWPAFCGGVDIVLGSWVIYLSQTGKALSTRGGAR